MELYTSNMMIDIFVYCLFLKGKSPNPRADQRNARGVSDIRQGRKRVYNASRARLSDPISRSKHIGPRAQKDGKLTLNNPDLNASINRFFRLRSTTRTKMGRSTLTSS